MKQYGSKRKAAAALGINITNHVAKTEINGNVSARKLVIMADNDANYTTTGTGVSMTLGKADTTVALGIGVAVNNDKALVFIKDGTQTDHVVLVGTEEVKIASELSQNMDGEYKGLLGVQSLAGSVSGSAKTAIAGAVSVLTSRAQTKTIVGDWTEIKGGENNEEAVSVTAEDKSKLAVRAGGVMIAAHGAKQGVGASFAFIYGHNVVTAQLKDNVSIKGKSLDLHAEKKSVSMDDFSVAFGVDKIITRSEEDVDKDDQGIIHLKRSGSGTDAKYEVSVNTSTDRIMDTVKLLNFLSSVNLYVESISGAVSTGSGDFTVAGSFAMAFLFDEVLSSVGDSVKIDLTGEMKNDASSETNVRVIAGGLSVSNSNLGVGAVLSFLYDEDEVRSEVGNGADIKAGGDYHQSASSRTDILDITVAGAATGSSGEATVGANLGAVVLLTKADAEVKDSAAIKADGTLDILSTQDNDTVLVAASVALTMGGIAGAGTLNVTVSDSEANITVGDGVTLTSGKDMALKADTTERLISVLASASASNGKEAASGVVSVLVDNAQTQVVLGKVKATATGNVTITADSNTRL
ncbi:MAG: hypothetical protein IIY73_00585, partial [Solobacterium sp.]|nr:hypothetical protein [Solobacterium sp.]